MNTPFPAGLPPLRLLIAAPRGFCAGVDRAIEIVEQAIRKYGAPVYVRHEIVHNRFVVDGLKAQGAIFVEELDEVPDGAPNSSNSMRLVEVAERFGTPARLVQRAHEIDPAWLEGVATLGLTAGASAPESLVRECVDMLARHRTVSEETVVSAEENMVFKLPRELTE